MIIGIDFDGTCVTHEYPEIGKDIGAQLVLKKLTEAGHQLILYTMRSCSRLEDAEKWFADNGIPLLASNINPTQHKWSKSPKVYCHLYIDDAALGVPLLFNENYSKRPFVDWSKVEEFLKMKGLI